MEASEEVMALVIVAMIALPSILLLLCILEESPVSTGKSFEELPVFCGMFSTSDVFGNAMASLICFFFCAIVLFGFAGFAGGWYVVLRGSQMSSPEGTSVGEMSGGYAFVQMTAHGLSSFGGMATSGGLSTATAGGIAAFLAPKNKTAPTMLKASAGVPTSHAQTSAQAAPKVAAPKVAAPKVAAPKERTPLVITDGPNGLEAVPLKKKSGTGQKKLQ